MTQQRVAQTAPGTRPQLPAVAGPARVRPPAVREVRPLRWDPWRCSAGLLCVLLAVTGIGLAFATRHVWFYIDEWTFIVDRTGPHPAVGILVPHNGHPSVVPALVWRGIWELVGLRSYLPYLVPVLVLHLLDVSLVWVLSRRSGAGPWACLAVAAVAAVGGVGAADITWAFQIGFLGSVAGALGAALLVDRAADRTAVDAGDRAAVDAGDRAAVDAGERHLPVGAWVLLTLSMSCSLMAVPLAVLPFGTAWARSGLRAALKLISLPALLLGAYLVVYGHLLFAAGQSPSPATVSTFAVSGIESVLAAVTGVPGTAVVAFVVVLVALRRGVLGAGAPLATAGLATVVAEYLFVGIGRSSQGTAAATPGRYAYVAVIVGLPAVAVLMTHLVRPRAPGRGRVALPAALAVAVALVCWNGCQLLGAELTTRDSYGTLVRGQYLAAQEILGDGGSLAAGLDLNARTLSLKAAALVEVGARDRLGPEPVAPADVAAVRQRLQLVFVPLVPRAPTRGGTWLPDTVLTARVGNPDLLVHPRPGFRISSVHGGVLTVSPPTSNPGPAAGWTGAGSCVTVAPAGAPFSVSLTPRGAASAVVVRPAGTSWGALSWGGQVGAAAETATGAIRLVGGSDYQLTMLGDAGRAVLSSEVALSFCGVTG